MTVIENLLSIQYGIHTYRPITCENEISVLYFFFFALYEEGVAPFYLLDFLVKSVTNKESVSEFETCAIFVVEAIVSIISITKNK